MFDKLKYVRWAERTKASNEDMNLTAVAKYYGMLESSLVEKISP